MRARGQAGRIANNRGAVISPQFRRGPRYAARGADRRETVFYAGRQIGRHWIRTDVWPHSQNGRRVCVAYCARVRVY